jgi:hypothetical protein
MKKKWITPKLKELIVNGGPATPQSSEGASYPPSS